MEFTEQLVRTLDARLVELRGEIDTLVRAREELVSNRAPGPAPANPATNAKLRPARRRARRTQTSSSTQVAPEGKLHRLLAQTDGLSTAALAQRANADPAQVLPLLRETEAAGRVRRTGERRATRWRAVANREDWIQQRAAELARRSKPA
jgi:hypothetical protein